MRILLLDTNHEILQNGLEKLGCICDEDYTSTKQQIEEKVNKYEGVVIRSRFNIDTQFIDKATNLKFIARVGAGLESIDVSYAEQKGIQLIAAPEGNRNAVGEHALGMLLALFNNIKKADLEIRNGKWLREANRGIELDGKTVGIIGYGNMGKAFAKKLKGFDVNVICFDIKENVGDENCKQVCLKELHEKTDVLSIHTPFNELSHKMINQEFISKFKKPIYFINTARGSAVVTNDLVEALESKKILGACLDVLEYEKSSFENLFENEDLPHSFEYLIKADNVLLSPHIAGWTVESHLKLAQTIVDKVEKQFFNTTPPEEIQPQKRVTGIGGLFFKSENPEVIKNWYKTHLGFNVDQWGSTFWWKNNENQPASTQWSPFKNDTTYFDPSKKEFMFNYRVADLVGLLKKLHEEGVTQTGTMEEYEYGKFAWILDCDGNKIELWEPIDTPFLT
ncbi:D-2-hydroxyacid dehydrogenase family protein [Lutibacter sp.]|uniref:D-2-hydroxyacid dehydrogenase family protein n=1 Tax=Lutibacter sp. TaxID=1925666 RepID=UPI0027346BEC|nr:D-2-hydroxyacid dehydrogenase family protein [Lutibacter sp.]MDP3312776.1 D-2-hydroxyacid dehydrogenase family protein [Lutibacter sp.]